MGPLAARRSDGEALVVWTTTPWTLPANRGGGEARRPLRAPGQRRLVRRRPPRRALRGGARGRRPGGLALPRPFDTLAPGAGVDHRVVPWEAVALDEGTGIVHIAPGCGSEDFALGEEHGLAVLAPVDEAGRFEPAYGWLAGRSAHEVADSVVADLDQRALLVSAGAVTHRYPESWRATPAHLPHLRRLVHLGAAGARAAPRRQPHGRVDAGLHGQAHGRLAGQHGRLEHLPAPLLRPAAAVLPLRLRAPHRRRLPARAGGAGHDRAGGPGGACAAPGSAR